MSRAAARPRALLPLLPALLVLAVWLPALGASFQFNDTALVTGPAPLRSLAAWWQAQPAPRPLATFSYAANHALGSAPAGYRAVNIALHACNAWLVFILLRRLARRLRVADESGAVLVAATATLIFALHPVQTESVTYVSGRPNLLLGSAVLLTMLCFTLRREERRPWWSQLLAVVLMGIALAANEAGLVMPAALWLLVSGERRVSPRAALLWVLPSLAAALAALGFAATRAPYAASLTALLSPQRWGPALVLKVHAISWLLGQLWRLDLLTADPALQVSTQFGAGVALTAVAMLLVIALGFALLRTQPGVAFGILWFFLWLAPAGALHAGGAVANDAQLYLAILGPAWLVGLALLRIPQGLRDILPSVAIGCIAILATTLTIATLLRNSVYATPVTFWQDAALKAPQDAHAALELGIAHARACEPLAARSALERAAALAPEDPAPRADLRLLEQGGLPGVPDAAACR